MKVREAIARIGFYEPPLEGREGEELLLLDFNESTQPPPKGVTDAMVRFLQQGSVNRYPAYSALTEKLAGYAGVSPEQIVLTNGSDQAIDIVLRSLLEPGDEMVFARPGFAMFTQVAGTLGAATVEIPYLPDMGFPYREMAAAVTGKTRLIVLINPNNPTGTAIESGQIEALLTRFPEVPVLVDEAYFEFTGATSVPLLARHDNLVILRTFSKAFAVAGLRLGYALAGPAFVRELHKIRGPYDVNALAVRGAEALLEHLDDLRLYTEEVMTRAKPMVEAFFAENGVAFFPGAANFMLVKPRDAKGACEFLLRRKVLVRPQKRPIEDTFRLSVGTVADMRRFIKVFAEYLKMGDAAEARGAGP